MTELRGTTLDLIGFDADYMGTWELAVTSQPYADFLVASAEYVNEEGWSYEDFLPELVNASEIGSPWTPQQLGTAIVQAYYDASIYNYTLGLFDLTQLQAVTEAVDTLALAMLDNPSQYSNFDTARDYSQGYYDADLIDLADFADNIGNISGLDAAVLSAAQDLQLALQATVIIALGQNAGYLGYHGLSIYYPAYTSPSLNYSSPDALWSTQTHWDEFLESL